MRREELGGAEENLVEADAVDGAVAGMEEDTVVEEGTVGSGKEVTGDRGTEGMAGRGKEGTAAAAEDLEENGETDTAVDSAEGGAGTGSTRAGTLSSSI